MQNRLTPVQLRGARAMLDWSIVRLAEASGMSVSTIKRMEQVEPMPVSEAAHTTVRATLEAAGIRFEARNGYGEGIWLRKAQQRSLAG